MIPKYEDKHDCSPDGFHECTIHVGCGEDCRALRNPNTPEEIKAAYIHWRYHSFLSGCSHAN